MASDDTTTKALQKMNENIDNLVVQNIDDNLVKRIANTDLDNDESKIYIIDFAQMFGSFFDFLKNELSENDLELYTNKVSKIARRIENHPELEEQFKKWLECRKELIDIAQSAAQSLDKNFIAINMARMFGSFFEILNAFVFNTDLYQNFCSRIGVYALTYSPTLKLITEKALELIPHLRFTGAVSSFFEIMVSQIIINRVVKVMKKDKDSFMPLKKWYDESKEIKDSVKKLFPFGIDEEIIVSINKFVNDLGEEQKVFSGILLSNIRKEPSIYKDGSFLVQLFLFCRSDVAKEWYKRIITGASPSSLESSMFYMRMELGALEGLGIDSGSKLEAARCSAGHVDSITRNNMPNLSRFILGGMSAISMYYCYENLINRSRHRFSQRLIELSENAQSFLNEIERSID